METTVELFAGIGGFRIAVDRHRIKTIWANDNCPLACQVYRSRFGTRELIEGDVTKRIKEIPSHDLLTAGFPCQPFSSAGKKQGIKDPRGTLFSHVVDAIDRNQPMHFVLENVKRLLTMERGVHFATIIAALAELDYLVEWRLVNALDFGLAQNRQRVIIIGTRSDLFEFGSEPTLIPSKLASVSDLTQFTQLQLDWMCLPHEWQSLYEHGKKFPNWGLAKGSKVFGANLQTFSDARSGIALREVLEDDVPVEFDFTESTLERLGNSIERNRFFNGVEILSNQGGGARMGYTVFGTSGVAPTLTSSASRHYERYKVGDRYRRLTNVEYARLQGFPDDHCSVSSVYNQYALYGNAVPPPIIEWAVGRLKAKPAPIRCVHSKSGQKELFVNA